MARSETRFTVEGCKHYDTAADALNEAYTMVYVSPERRASALAELLAGKQVMLTYGFCSVNVSPPRPTHPFIERPED